MTDLQPQWPWDSIYFHIFSPTFFGNAEKTNSGYTVTLFTWACKPTAVAFFAFEKEFERFKLESRQRPKFVASVPFHARADKLFHSRTCAERFVCTAKNLLHATTRRKFVSVCDSFLGIRVYTMHV